MHDCYCAGWQLGINCQQFTLMPAISITSTQLNYILSFFPEFLSSCISLICIHVNSADMELALIITFIKHLLSLEDKIWGFSPNNYFWLPLILPFQLEVSIKSQPSLMQPSANLTGYSVPPPKGFQVGTEEKSMANNGNIREEMGSESHYLELQGQVGHKVREND